MGARARSVALVACWVALGLSLTGCVRGCPSSRPPIHVNPNMDDQPRYDPQQESAFFYDGKSMRLPVPGTVARGELREDAIFYTGRDDFFDELVVDSPIEATEQVLARGEERFGIYCSPCHEKGGTGRGILFEYARIPMPSFHEPRILDLPDGQIFETITNGKGLMQPYGAAIPPADRWAIIVHVRRLQREGPQEQGPPAEGAP